MSQTLTRPNGTTIIVYSLEELGAVNPDAFIQALAEARESATNLFLETDLPLDDLEEKTDDDYVDQDVREGWGYCSEGCALGMEDDGFMLDDCEH